MIGEQSGAGAILRFEVNGRTNAFVASPSGSCEHNRRFTPRQIAIAAEVLAEMGWVPSQEPSWALA